MFLSIIIPTYNRPGSLLKGLSALKRELGLAVDAEVIVVDDGSPFPASNENSMLSNRTGVRYIAHMQRRGAAAARNTGLKVSSGTWIVFLDDDVSVRQDWYVRLRETLESLPADVVGVEGMVEAEGNGLWDREVTNENGGLFLTCHCIYRADVLKKENGFDEHFAGRYPSCEDHELASRMLRWGKVIFEKNLSVVHSSRQRNLLSYCAGSLERMKSNLDAEYYFYVKQRDRYHLFRHSATFFGTLRAILFKHTITTLRRRTAGDLARHPIQFVSLVFSCLLEQAYAWLLMPVFARRFMAGHTGFFSGLIDMKKTRELWSGGGPLSIGDFRLQRSALKSLAFPLLHAPVYSAIPPLVHLAKTATQKRPLRCFFRIDDVFLDQTCRVERMCAVMREKGVPFLASIVGVQLIDKRYDRLVEMVLENNGEIGLHGFYHQGRFGPYDSEVLQLTFKKMDVNIEAVVSKRAQSRHPLAFVPPFNAIQRDQIYHAGTYFPIVCGGPETARFADGLFGPLALNNGSIYFPAFFPFYASAAEILRSNALEKLERLGGIVCVSLHMPGEAENGFADMKRVLEKLCETTVPWRSLIQ